MKATIRISNRLPWQQENLDNLARVEAQLHKKLVRDVVTYIDTMIGRQWGKDEQSKNESCFTKMFAEADKSHLTGIDRFALVVAARNKELIKAADYIRENILDKTGSAEQAKKYGWIVKDFYDLAYGKGKHMGGIAVEAAVGLASIRELKHDREGTKGSISSWGLDANADPVLETILRRINPALMRQHIDVKLTAVLS